MLSGHCLSCPFCLSVTLVYCGQTFAWIKMPLGMEAGLGPGHTVLDGNRAPPKGAQLTPQFSAHVCFGQTARCIKMPLDMEVGLGPGDTVFKDWTQLPLKKGVQPPIFSPCLFWPNGGWIKMPLGTKIGLDPCDIMLDRDPAPRPKRGTAAPSFSIVAKRLDRSRCHLVQSSASEQAILGDFFSA